MNGLAAHVDTRRVGLDKVLEVATPERTKTWGVIGHGQLIQTLKSSVVDAGHKIMNEEYSLSQDGGKMFGIFTLDHTTSDLAWMIGFRNSINKTLKVGITAGTRVFVCDNLAFSGSFIRFRKHTGGLDLDELKELSDDAVGQMETRLSGFESWQMALKNYALRNTDKEALTFRAINQGVLPPGKFAAFHKLYFKRENGDNDAVYGDSLYGFHGAMTQLWKNNSLIGVGERHGNLETLLDRAADEITLHGMVRNGL